MRQVFLFCFSAIVDMAKSSNEYIEDNFLFLFVIKVLQQPLNLAVTLKITKFCSLAIRDCGLQTNDDIFYRSL